MPDRAVVDEVPCAWCSGDGYVTGSMPCPECTPAPRAVMDDYTWVTCAACGAERLKPVEPTPRALVALSEDRRVIMALDPDGRFWSVHRWDGVNMHSDRWTRDTGQGADAVLAAFLSGEGASDA